MDSVGSEVSQWEEMIAHPEEWIDEWHTLRLSMKHREVSHHSATLQFLIVNDMFYFCKYSIIVVAYFVKWTI